VLEQIEGQRLMDRVDVLISGGRRRRERPRWENVGVCGSMWRQFWRD